MSWNKASLAEIVSITKGKKHLEIDDFTAQRYIQIEDLGSANVNKFTNERGVEVLPNDVIIAWDGANAGKVGANLQGVIGSTLARLRPLDDLIVGQFLFRFLQAKETEIKSKRTGATIPHVNGQELRNLQIPLPPLSTQQKIAAILDKADELRRKDKALLAHYDELLQSIFYKMFGDPVKNEKGWEVKKVIDVCKKITDGEHQTPKRQSSGIKLLSARNIKNGYIDYAAGLDFIGEDEFARISKRCNPEFGDLLISCSGSIGRVTSVKVTEPFSLVRSVALLKLNKDMLDSSFAECLFQTDFMQMQIRKRAKASSQANLFTGAIKELEIVLPPLKVQNIFKKMVEQVYKQKQNSEMQLDQSHCLFQSLLQKAFKGELVQ